MQFILVRHGDSEFNDINRHLVNDHLYTGQYNISLTKKGMAKARQLKETNLFQDIHHLVYTSDLMRAHDTAKLAMPYHEIITDTRIRERSLGIFENKYHSDIFPHYKVFFKNNPNFSHSFTEKAFKGENYTDVVYRVTSFLQEFDLSLNQTVVIFSHYCCIRCFLYILLNLTEQQTLQFKVPNCLPLVLTGSELGTFKLLD